MEVSQILAFGQLASLALKKYGDRQDEHQRYPHFISVYLPRSRHEALKSERSSVAGQGELKKMQFDLLFIVNHTCALLRADVNRLIRKTWCSTKDPERLEDHLEKFRYFHNQKLLRGNLTPLE